MRITAMGFEDFSLLLIPIEFSMAALNRNAVWPVEITFEKKNGGVKIKVGGKQLGGGSEGFEVPKGISDHFWVHLIARYIRIQILTGSKYAIIFDDKDIFDCPLLKIDKA